jgi:hypothetical protein
MPSKKKKSRAHPYQQVTGDQANTEIQESTDTLHNQSGINAITTRSLSRPRRVASHTVTSQSQDNMDPAQDVPIQQDIGTAANLTNEVKSLKTTVSQLTRMVHLNNQFMADFKKSTLNSAAVGGHSSLQATDRSQATGCESLNNIPELDPVQDQVNASVEQHLEVLMTEQQPTDSGNEFVSYAIPLDNSVSDKVKSQIWADQYVDFSKLSEPDVPGEYDLRLVPGATGGQIKLAPSKQAKPIYSVGQWCKAFHVYMSVYTEKFPT